MKAIISTGYGTPEVLQLRDIEKPTPKDHEVLIKIHAASVTTADGMMRTGKPYFGRMFTGLMKPKNVIPGTGFAGEVEAVGKDVLLFKKGDRVLGESIASFGTHAEYVCVPEDAPIIKKPINMTYEEAAPVCDGALTSLNFLKYLAQISPGQKILINGASGSLGTAAVQLAKYYDAEVTGVSSTRNLELVKSLGADHVIDYTNEDFTANGETYDIIYDTLGKRSYSECKNSLSQYGVYVSPVLDMKLIFQMLWTSKIGTKKAKFAATGLMPPSALKILLNELKEVIELGKLISVIDREYSIEQIVDAHTYIDKGHKKGNVILTV